MRESIQKNSPVPVHGFEEEPRIHMITAGDFTQLPLCFEKYLFEYAATYRKEKDELEEGTKRERSVIFQHEKCKSVQYNRISFLEDISDSRKTN